ncbi:5'-nucleotidase C-terminal domain-containing protein [Jiangella sp. DSM 45060]|uniref:5'-nucleotidase C-terminal domain-containing protein n=1 Tax=Jiangella sp. DSM 45060 TaxID=1798224 RepID=UPI00087B3E49|nr:5'-nucleotidase C-terminal domain-containing protein [Jiangella sp. DSM 45060]SDT71812.1 5'-nucleotidase [Jiangella sp. DSM 45060]
MRLNRRFHRALGAAAALGLTGVGLSAVPAQAAEVQIDVLGINDFHGRISADGQAAGAAVLAGAVADVSGPNTVFAAAGDLIGASTFTSFIQQDNPTIDALSDAGLDVSAVGNHEFDQGYCDLIDRVIPRATWEYIGANVTVADGATTGCETANEIAPTWTETFDGVTVGFVGAVTEHLPELVSPSGIEALEVGDIVEATNASAAELKADGADIVVLLVHEGAATTSVESATDPASDFGKIVTGVSADIDAIVSGHTHLAYNHAIEVPEWADREVTTRPVVSAGQYGYNLNKISFTYDTDAGAVAAVTSDIIPLTEQDEEGEWHPLFPADEAIAEDVAAAEAAAEELGAEPLGDITADFNRAAQNPTEENPAPENRGGESTLGNFVADVQLVAARMTDLDAQIAFMNPGGLRADLKFLGTGEKDPDGNVSYQEAALVQPFANTLVTTTLTGEQIAQVLEEQWQPAGASRPFLKLGVSRELTYTYDPAAAPGERITSMSLVGNPVEPDGEYRVVVNSFLASGGDNFATLAQGSNPTDTGQVDLQAMVSYLGENSPASPDLAQRAVGVSWVSDPEAVYETGDEIAVDLSSLLFSNGEPVDATATVTLAGQEVGKVDVDPTIVDTTDEVGRAQVRVTVPAGTADSAKEAAETTLVVELPETGTTVTLPVTVDFGDDPGTDDGDENGDDNGAEDGGDENGTDDGTDSGTEDGGDQNGADENGSDDGTDSGADDGTEDGDELPDTGSSGVLWWVIGGVVVLALGGGLFALSRRKGAGTGSGTPEA